MSIEAYRERLNPDHTVVPVVPGESPVLWEKNRGRFGLCERRVAERQGAVRLWEVQAVLFVRDPQIRQAASGPEENYWTFLSYRFPTHHRFHRLASMTIEIDGKRTSPNTVDYGNPWNRWDTARESNAAGGSFASLFLSLFSSSFSQL